MVQCSPKQSDKTAETTEKSEQMKRGMASEQEFRKTAPEPAPAPEIEIGDYQTMTLENGLEVIVVENHKLPKVSFRVFVDRPPVQEGEHAGYVEIAGNLLKTGTDNRTKAEIDEEIDFIGASFSTNSKGASGSCLSDHKESLLEIMSDVILHPSFPEAEFEKAKKQKLSAIAAEQNDPNAIARNIRQLANFGDHPYGEFATETSVNSIDLDLCKNYYQEYFKPNKAYFVVVGDITAKEAKALASKYFGQWEKGPFPDTDYETPKRPTPREVVFVDRPGAVQSVINITHPVDLSMASEDYIAASVMNSILGGGVFSGYLMQNLREDKGYTYGARSILSQDPYIGYFNAYASVRNEVTDSAVVEFLREMSRICNEEVEEDHLSLVKNSMSGSFARSLENPQNIANQALAIARFDLPEDFFKTYLQRIEAVSPEEIQRVAQRYVYPTSCNIVVVGNKDEVAEKLKRFDGDEELTFYTTEGEVVDQLDGEIPEGMTAEQVISNYVKAIGGKEKLKEVQSLIWNIQMDMMSMQIKGTRYIEFPDKYADISEMNGMVVQKMIYNQGEGISMNAQQGTKQMEGSDLKDAKMNAHIFKEMYYDDMGMELKIAGVEKVEGEKAYKIKVKKAEDKSITEFYSLESGLKLREISMSKGPNGPIPVTVDYQDYKEVEGILFPHSMEISGPFPQPMKMETQSVEVNADIDESVFKLKD
jgi:predicted Zn-dependent peptidase